MVNSENAMIAARDVFYTQVAPDIRKRIDELRDAVDQEWAKKRRTAFLKASMAEIIEMLFQLLEDHGSYLHRKQTIAALLTHADIRKKVKEVLRLQLEIFDLRGGDASPGIRISEEDIRRAREFPFTELIEVKRGMAICPFHEDHDPSFHIKNNRGFCFGCGWRGDTIAFVMARDAKTFTAAVRSLL